MVLKRALLLLALVGCKQSLFDANNGDDDTSVDSGVVGDGMVQQTCGAMCLGDAGGDFGETTWQYLEDKRNRTWTAMTETGSAYVGADAANKISACDRESKPACSTLPHALLMSSAGGTAAADPAIGFTLMTKQVVKVSLRVRVEGNAAQQLRLYRNSREDSLFTAVAQPGVTVETSMQVDALPNDRFVFALSPADAGAADVAVQLFINGTGLSFPQDCVMGVQWDRAQVSGKSENLCGTALTYWDDSGMTTMQTGELIGAAPFPELGTGATMKENFYYEAGDIIDHSVDTTTQLWVKQTTVGFTNAAVFSDVDAYRPGGIGIYLDTIDTVTVESPKSASNNEYGQATGAYPQDHQWHFIRVTHTMGNVYLCLDGKRIGSYAISPEGMTTTKHPYLGRSPGSVTAVLDGAIDDVRVFKGALPCD